MVIDMQGRVSGLLPFKVRLKELKCGKLLIKKCTKQKFNLINDDTN